MPDQHYILPYGLFVQTHYLHTYPSNGSYQIPSGLYHAPDPTYENDATVAQLVPSANGYHDPGAEFEVVIRVPEEVQLLSEEMVSVTTPTTPPPCTGICQYPNNSGFGICGVPITCEGVSAHFKRAHGIRNMNEFDEVVCKWGRCYRKILRKNFVRHIRSHLGHSRSRGCSP